MGGLRPMPTAPSLLGLPVVPLVPISTPVVASVLDIAKQALGQAFPNQTRILVLMNMVSDDDLANDQEYEELIAEVRDECAKYGTLLSIKIPRSHDAGIEPSAVKKVFLEYDSVQVAVAAESELNGRSFGTNKVQTSFFSEEDYAKGNLS